MTPAGGAALLPDRLAELRDAFDRSFAEPPTASARAEDLLAVTVAGTAYAIRLDAISGLFADRCVTPLPGPLPELLGVAAFRGSIIAVYDLGALLHHPKPAESPPHRWLVLDAGTPAVALAFDRLDGHLRVPAGSIAAAGEEGTGSPAYLPEVVRAPDGMRPVIAIGALRAAIEHKSQQIHNGRKR
jgi:purine-binding chemotaxis protein CheW